MKKILGIFLIVLCVTSSAVHAKDINILFIGNSFTFRHDLPNLVKDVIEEGHPDLNVHVEKIVYGGQDLFRHHDLYQSDAWLRLNSITIPEVEEKKAAVQKMIDAGSAPDFYQSYWEKTGLKPIPWDGIRKNLVQAVKGLDKLLLRIQTNKRVKWDYVVLQSWQDIVPDIDAGYGEYAQKFASIAKQEGIQVILYVTAPHAANQEPVGEPLKLQQTQLEMNAIRSLMERIQPHAVVPVGLGIANIQNTGTDLKFRYVNDFHPNQTCAYLTANMFYAALFNQSPEGFKFNRVVETNSKGKGDGKDPDGGNAEVVFNEPVKSQLQKAAYDAVKEFTGAGQSNPPKE